MKFKIYQIIVGQKKYIGRTTQKDYNRLLQELKCTNNTKLSKRLLKYQEKSFSFSILFEGDGDLDTMRYVEQYFISKNNSVQKGLNMRNEIKNPDKNEAYLLIKEYMDKQPIPSLNIKKNPLKMAS